MDMREAAEAGRLVEALENTDELIDRAATHPDDDVGVGLGYEYSESGNSQMAGDAIVGKVIAQKVLGYMRGLLVERLVELGVHDAAS